MTPKKILFLLAHQDDEVFVVPRISYELSRGARPLFIYLTSGVAEDPSENERDNESRACLTRLGVEDEQIIFLGTESRIPDGCLVNHLEQCFLSLVEKTRDYTFDEIYTPSWEGGHQDHDAAFLLGLALARRLNLEDSVWQFYLYNGFRTRGRFFRVSCPLPVACRRRQRKLNLFEGILTLKSIFAFKSQRKTWLGLLPQILIHVLFFRTEVFDHAKVEQILTPPHKGVLLYERWKRMTFIDFRREAAAFEAKFIVDETTH
jgi:LmbE family N-acetylglucosaminyl deacetylase